MLGGLGMGTQYREHNHQVYRSGARKHLTGGKNRAALQFPTRGRSSLQIKIGSLMRFEVGL